MSRSTSTPGLLVLSRRLRELITSRIVESDLSMALPLVTKEPYNVSSWPARWGIDVSTLQQCIESNDKAAPYLPIAEVIASLHLPPLTGY